MRGRWLTLRATRRSDLGRCTQELIACKNRSNRQAKCKFTFPDVWKELVSLRDGLWNPNDADASLGALALASYRLALRRARGIANIRFKDGAFHDHTGTKLTGDEIDARARASQLLRTEGIGGSTLRRMAVIRAAVDAHERDVGAPSQPGGGVAPVRGSGVREPGVPEAGGEGTPSALDDLARELSAGAVQEAGGMPPLYAQAQGEDGGASLTGRRDRPR